MTASENRKRLYEEATMSGPGHDGYAFQADVYCIGCGRAIIREIVASYPEHSLTDHSEIPCDSNDFPMPIFFGESDSPEHCSECGEYLYGPDEKEEDE